MLKVKLKYTDCIEDKRRVYGIISYYNNIKVLKTRAGFDIHPTITLLIKDYYELNQLVGMLNCYTDYGVEIKKVKDLDESILHKFFKRNDNDDVT